MAILRNFTRRLFISLNILTVVLFLLACANSALHPGKWWVVSMLGLIFPLLLLLLLIFFIVGLFLSHYRLWSMLSLLTLLIGWSNIHSFIALHPGAGFTMKKPAGSIRLMTWNIRSFDEYITRKKGASGHRVKMLDFIDSIHPDILCLQEFLEAHHPNDTPNIPYIEQQLHFPFHVFSRDYGRYDGKWSSGVIIFSRYPITDSLSMHYSKPDGVSSTESLIAADVQIGDDTVRVFTTHLQSVLFRSKDYHDIEIIKNVDDSILMASKSIAKKLSYASRHRGDQAEEVRVRLDRSPFPGIICGDFNDVPNSYAYFTIRGSWKDAFLQKGFGIGRTYVHISPTLRIDYILADPDFEILQCRKFSVPWSDHNPVVADVRLPSTEK
ncbi:MAG TPA: endonuclease/exonuclease/phosphatase family protein [Puia sp.]|nr:endonuclease/exonuclease/phosphatase family protein [Puia sp.]